MPISKKLRASLFCARIYSAYDARMFDYDISERLRKELEKLARKNPALKIALKKKMREIICRDENTIEFFKNLEAPLNEYKRVRVGSFILTFKYDRTRRFIFFQSFCHHDEAYRK